ncbi:MAG: hypothetical protein ABGW78_02145 [Pirellulales bacterium]
MLWSLTKAHHAGFDVDRTALDELRAWSLEPMHFEKPINRESTTVLQTLAGNIDTINALFIGDQIADKKQSSVFSKALVENQENDGSWKPCGQLPNQKRSKAETRQVTTLWTTLILAQQNIKPKNIQAIEQIIENDSPESTEWLTARMLLARERGESSVQNTLIQELIKRQHHDGGWGWLSSEQSDALGTGMALYALKRSSYPESSYDPSAIRARAARATHYLTETQEPNGSWIVMGTKNKTRNRPTETATFWGTAWAVIALLQD